MLISAILSVIYGGSIPSEPLTTEAFNADTGNLNNQESIQYLYTYTYSDIIICILFNYKYKLDNLLPHNIVNFTSCSVRLENKGVLLARKVVKSLVLVLCNQAELMHIMSWLMRCKMPSTLLRSEPDLIWAKVVHLFGGWELIWNSFYWQFSINR